MGATEGIYRVDPAFTLSRKLPRLDKADGFTLTVVERLTIRTRLCEHWAWNTDDQYQREQGLERPSSQTG